MPTADNCYSMVCSPRSKYKLPDIVPVACCGLLVVAEEGAGMWCQLCLGLSTTCFMGTAIRFMAIFLLLVNKMGQLSSFSILNSMGQCGRYKPCVISSYLSSYLVILVLFSSSLFYCFPLFLIVLLQLSNQLSTVCTPWNGDTHTIITFVAW